VFGAGGGFGQNPQQQPQQPQQANSMFGNLTPNPNPTPAAGGSTFGLSISFSSHNLFLTRHSARGIWGQYQQSVYVWCYKACNGVRCVWWGRHDCFWRRWWNIWSRGSIPTCGVKYEPVWTTEHEYWCIRGGKVWQQARD